MENRFDKEKHRYYIGERPVPSVTQILREVLGDAIWSAGDWYLERGRAVHLAAAMIAQEKLFSFDPQITGQVAACRRFFADMKPEVFDTETQCFSQQYQFGGTCDMVAAIGGKICIVDWKPQLSELGKIQLGGYGVLHPAAKCGLVVALEENEGEGKYRTSGIFKLDQYKREFLACLTVYNLRKRLGCLKTKQEVNDGKSNDGN